MSKLKDLEKGILVWCLAIFVVATAVAFLRLNLADLTSIVTILATAGGAFLAIQGIDTWKRQLRGSTDHDIAWKYLRGVYKVRDAINKVVRNPAIFPVESEAASREYYGEDKFEAMITGNARAADEAVYAIRWKELNKARVEFEDAAVQAEIWWGKRVREFEKPLNACIGKLFVNIKTSLDDKRQRAGMKYDHDTIYYLEGAEGDFDKDLNKVIADMEAFARPYLREN